MQEVVKLNIVVRRIENVVLNSERSGVTFCRIASFPMSSTITTDRLLVSEEAVRVIDVRR